MRSFQLAFAFVLLLTCAGFGQVTDGLAAAWNFDEGDGQTLNDASGHNNHGTIHGAKWIDAGDGHALRFDGVDDYVDCGEGRTLDITNAITLEAWIHPDAPAVGEPGVIGKNYDSFAITFYKTGSTYFYVHGGGNGTFGSIPVGDWTHIVGTFDGTTMRFYVNGELINEHTSRYPQAEHGRNFIMGAMFGDPDNPDPNQAHVTYFAGAIDSVRVYDRALAAEEVVQQYNLEAASKGREPFDTSQFGQLALKPYVYDTTIVADVAYKWIKPLPAGEPIRVTLTGSSITREIEVAADNPRDLVEATIDTTDLPAGQYVLTASIGDHIATTTVALPKTVPDPAIATAPPLPADVEPPAYTMSVADQGGIVVDISGQAFVVETSYSYPHGGFNGLVATERGDLKPQSDWSVTSTRREDGSYVVRAEGPTYAIERTVTPGPTRIDVRDTITNRTDEIIGIILSNHLNLRSTDASPTLRANPTVFASRGGRGVGLIALDDITFLQLHTRYLDDLVELRDADFGLNKQASYTVHWAIYPMATDDYFDFINQVRHDERINGHVAGGLTLSTGWDALSVAEVARKGLRYICQCYLTGVTRDPVISIEGWEFLEYPEVCDRIRTTMAASRRLHPDVKVGFHSAHALYATNEPDRFADSKAIDINGNQLMYGPDSMDYYGRYFSKELVEAGWRWWLYYPTMENSFGKLMIDAADYMINDLGANMVWADGYISGYVRDGYSYDHFDGHSVTIDPDTKLVTRTKTNVTYAALPVLKRVAQMFADAGGVLISNGKPGPPSYWSIPTITSNETGGGDQQPVDMALLGRTVTPLGNPGIIQSQRDVYRDVLIKINLGALYFFYGETDHRPGGHNYVHDDLIVKHMYPITFDNIKPGIVRGLERIVTVRDGVYGWEDDRALHVVHYSDGRGQLVPSRFTTTVDTAGVRTVLQLDADESAVVAKIPGVLSCDTPVNLIVRRYGESGIDIVADGNGKATFTFDHGAFAVYRGLMYGLKINGTSQQIADHSEQLTFTVSLDGPTRIEVTHFTPGG